ncbi:SRPBCC family protein [Actinospongicola halichondriae]|uniref:SRPBCC family protein n=1 Tax=Actinospongicola halichondriae TaxID=3236844 RepID=UPI003D4C6AA8
MTEPQSPMSVSRSIAAPAAVLFAHLTRPEDHPAIDGSGLLLGTNHQVLSGVGDVYEMRMCNDFLGDYVIENNVVEFERDRLIAWEPVLKETSHPEAQSNIGVRAHLRWRWELTPQSDGETLVTESYDLSRSPKWLHEATKEGEDWREAMETSLENLAGMVEKT